MTHTRHDYELDKQCQAMLDKAVSDADAVLKTFPRGPMGLTPDDVKLSKPYQDAKWTYSKAFAALQGFNARFVKKYKKELAADRKLRRAGSNERQEMLREQEPVDNRLHPDDPLNGVKVIADALEYVGTYGAGNGLEGMKQWGQIVTWCRDAVRILGKAEQDYRGLATCAANNGMRATAKDANETADYIKAFLEGKS